MRKNKVKDIFLDNLKKIPIIQLACEKSNVSRNSVYRWKNDDLEFAKQMEEAILEGEALINDLTESQLLTLIKEKSWQAISFWLRHRNPKFKEKVEITTRIVDETLSPEQEEIVRNALSMVNNKKHV